MLLEDVEKLVLRDALYDMNFHDRRLQREIASAKVVFSDWRGRGAAVDDKEIKKINDLPANFRQENPNTQFSGIGIASIGMYCSPGAQILADELDSAELKTIGRARAHFSIPLQIQ